MENPELVGERLTSSTATVLGYAAEKGCENGSNLAVLWLAERGKLGRGGEAEGSWLQRDRLCPPSDSMCTGGWHPAVV